MRWGLKPVPKEGDIRIINTFLLWPKTINNETRWLEATSFKQKRCYWKDDERDGYDNGFWYWEDLEWIL